MINKKDHGIAPTMRQHALQNFVPSDEISGGEICAPQLFSGSIKNTVTDSVFYVLALEMFQLVWYYQYVPKQRKKAIQWI